MIFHKRIELFFRMLFNGSLFYTLIDRFHIFRKTGKYHRNVFSYGGRLDLCNRGQLSFPKKDRVVFINGSHDAVLGNCRRCKLNIYKGANLSFGGGIGLSNVVIVATKSITIGKNVMIGGGCTIVDSDFHSLTPSDWFTERDEINMVSEPVAIGDNVFLGMQTIVLKGVQIGEGAVIAAGSVVTKSIPSNEIWGGNPAIFIKKR